MIDLIKRWLTVRQQRLQVSRNNILREQFQVNERGGHLFIIYNDVAVKRVEPKTSATEIREMLEKMRNAAVEYDNY